MIDSRKVGIPFNEPTLWLGRFKGAGTNSIPLAVASTSKKMAITTYSNLGAMVVTINDAAAPATTGGSTGVVQSYSAWVGSGLIGAANAKQVQMSPPSANSAAFTLQIQYANGTAIDIATTEELVVEVWTSRSGNP